MSNLDLSTTPVNTTTLADRTWVQGHPDDILSDKALTTSEKREILAAWASDAHSVPDNPSFRQLPSGALVEVSDVLRALQVLDATELSPSRPRHSTASKIQRRPLFTRLFAALKRRDDDDDDPPPTPTAALPFDIAVARRRKWDHEGMDGDRQPIAA